MEKQSRTDKGKTRKVKPEDILEGDPDRAPPKVPGRVPKRSVLYRLCIEQAASALASRPHHFLPADPGI